MIGINYLKQLINNYKYYKRLKESKMTLIEGRVPSSSYIKYKANHNFDGKKVLNFGCGKSIYKSSNVLNVDVVANEGVIIRDPRRSLAQFGRDFDFILANHVLEHIPNWFNIMKEFADILKPGGIIEIWIPPVSSDAAFTYRDHINFIGLDSFAGCNSHQRPGTNLLSAEEFETLGEFKKLSLIEKRTRTIVKWWTLLAPDFILAWMCTYLRNIVSEEGFIFQKLQ